MTIDVPAFTLTWWHFGLWLWVGFWVWFLTLQYVNDYRIPWRRLHWRRFLLLAVVFTVLWPWAFWQLCAAIWEDVSDYRQRRRWRREAES